MPARRLRVRIPTHHARKLSGAFFTFKHADRSPAIQLLDVEMMISIGSNLCKVSHDNNLMMIGESSKARANLHCRFPANSRVNLIKNEGDITVGLPQNHL